jgi:hypothetical protein
MTLLIPTPRSVALAVLRHALDRARALLVAFLGLAPPSTRHGVHGPPQDRAGQGESLFGRHASTTLQDRPVRHPDRLAPPRREPRPAPAWNPPHRSTRTAQPEEGVRPHDHHRPDEPFRPSADGTTDDLAVEWPTDTIAWPLVDEDLPPARHALRDDRDDRVDTGFTGYFESSAVPEPDALGPAVVEWLVPGPAVVGAGALEAAIPQTAEEPNFEGPAVACPTFEGSAFEGSAFADAAFADAAVVDLAGADPVADLAVDDPVTVPYTLGDLARWWAEAAARLDAEVGTDFRSRPPW